MTKQSTKVTEVIEIIKENIALLASGNEQEVLDKVFDAKIYARQSDATRIFNKHVPELVEEYQTKELRKMLFNKITVLQNKQNDLVLESIHELGLFKNKTEARKAFNKQSKFVLKAHKEKVAMNASQETVNNDGTARKKVMTRGGKITYANQVRQSIINTLEGDLPLTALCDNVTQLTTQRYIDNGKAAGRKPSYFRLVARNEIQRLMPKVQAELGMPVSTPAEIRMATRKRDWKKRVIAM